MMVKRVTLETCDDISVLFDQYRVFYNQPSNLQVALNFLKARLKNNESVIFAGYSDSGLPLAFTQLYKEFSSVYATRRWILNDLYVKEGFRNSGLGKTLIQTVIDFVKTDKAESISLQTAKDNLSAKGLYEKMGFKLNPPETEFDGYTFHIP